jgi:hypothetical protein
MSEFRKRPTNSRSNSYAAGGSRSASSKKRVNVSRRSSKTGMFGVWRAVRKPRKKAEVATSHSGSSRMAGSALRTMLAA